MKSTQLSRLCSHVSEVAGAPGDSMFLKWLESRAPNRFGVKFISSSESSACGAGRARHGAGASLILKP